MKMTIISSKLPRSGLLSTPEDGMAWGTRILDTVVIGAGPAGLGTALALSGVDDLAFGVLERAAIGQTFVDWPTGQRFLTPSFTGNGFGATDLNAIHPSTSPAYTLGTDYPDGRSYAGYLRAVASHFKIPVAEHADVTAVTAARDGFDLETSRGAVRARTVVWAGGEFHHPATPPIEGKDLLDHSSSSAAWVPRGDAGDELVIIGGYESGMDLASHHVGQGASVVVVDAGAPWDDGSKGADPSFLLAPRTRVRLKQALATGRLTVVAANAVRVTDEHGRFLVELGDGRKLLSRARPISAVGYGPGLGPAADLFDRRDDGWPLIDEDDQSTKTPGLFLSGPAVRHKNLKFCFIYKYRQRFAHIAGVIGRSLGKDVSALEAWREAGMLTDDLSCCGVECAC
jgi:putative flavoprotein involved in K+ transport